MNNELTDREKDVAAHALFNYVAGQGGSPVFLEVMEIVGKLNILDKFAAISLAVVQEADRKRLEEIKKKEDDLKT